MRRWNGSVLVQVMACRRFGAESLPDPMLIYCQLDPKEHTSVKFEAKYKTIHSRNTSENVVCEMAAILSSGRWVIWQPRGSDMLPKFLENFQKSQIGEWYTTCDVSTPTFSFIWWLSLNRPCYYILVDISNCSHVAMRLFSCWQNTSN